MVNLAVAAEIDTPEILSIYSHDEEEEQGVPIARVSTLATLPVLGAVEARARAAENIRCNVCMPLPEAPPSTPLPDLCFIISGDWTFVAAAAVA